MQSKQSEKRNKGRPTAFSFFAPSILLIEMVRTLSPSSVVHGRSYNCGTLVAEQMSAKTSFCIEFKKKKIDNYLAPAAGLVFQQLLLMDYIYQRPQLLALFLSWIP